MVVLQWIRKSPVTLKTFVANKVSEIQDLTATCKWRHVPTADNPADFISRGKTAEELMHLKTWWSGPSWLCETEDRWPIPAHIPMDKVEEAVKEEINVAVVAATGGNGLQELHINSVRLPEDCATWGKLIRVTAYVLRYKFNLLAKVRKMERRAGPLSVIEQLWAIEFWVKKVQGVEFSAEIKSLRAGRAIAGASKLISLNPFLDNSSILRVGGRLAEASLTRDKQHPIILPARGRITELLIIDAHKITLHGGVQLCMQYLRQKFWILSQRRAVKGVIHQCVPCCRQSKVMAEQQMGDLPSFRVEQCRAFKRAGVDYAGPFKIKARSGRSYIIEKGYSSV